MMTTGDGRQCPHELPTWTAEEVDAVRWLMGVLDKMIAGSGPNAERALRVRRVLSQISVSHERLHVALHVAELMLAGATAADGVTLSGVATTPIETTPDPKDAN